MGLGLLTVTVTATVTAAVTATARHAAVVSAATFLFGVEFAFAGACCGGGSSVAGVILGDEKYLLGLDLDSKTITTDVSAKGVWRDRLELEEQQTLKLHLTSLISDRFQLGVSPSLVKKHRYGDTDTSLGDTSLLLAYEALPDWDYHPIRPRGTVYLSASIPTGKSVYDSQSTGFLDAAGKGYASLGLGAIFNKTISKWTAIFSTEAHHGFDKSPIRPSWGYTTSLSFSYDLASWIKGLYVQTGLSHTYQNVFHLEQSQFEGNQSLETVDALQVTAPSIGLSYSGIPFLPESEDPLVFHLTYSDQSLLGMPLNTPLGKTLSVGIRKQILR